MGKNNKNKVFFSIDDVINSGESEFINCQFRGVDFSGVDSTWTFYGCKFVKCKMAGLTATSIASHIFGYGDGLVHEKESALLLCEGIDNIKFLRPKEVFAFVSDDTGATLFNREYHDSIDWITECYSINAEEYLTCA